MRKKILAAFTAFILVAINAFAVFAVIDQEAVSSDITLPSLITIQSNGISTGTIRAASGYTNLQYQKIDLTKVEYDALGEKYNAYSTGVATYNAELEQKQAELDELAESINNETDATQKAALQAQYDEKFAAAQEWSTSEVSRLQGLKDEFYNSMPEPSDSAWVNVAGTSGDVVYNFGDKEPGMIYFMLYGRATKDEATKYNFAMYATQIPETPVSSLILTPATVDIKVGQTQQLEVTVLPTTATNKEVTWTVVDSSIATVSDTGLVEGVSEGTTTVTVTSNADASKTATARINVTKAAVTPNPTEDETIYHDYSNAKFELVKDGDSYANINVTGINYKDSDSSTYYRAFVSNRNDLTPVDFDFTVSDDNNAFIIIEDKDKKSATITHVEKAVEKNQKLYVYVVGRRGEEKKVLAGPKELTRFEEASFTDLFPDWTMAAYNKLQVALNVTHAKVNTRKLKIKIGEITDSSLLASLKEGKVDAWTNLLGYAKKAKGIYDETKIVENSSRMFYETTDRIMPTSALKDKTYYYLYLCAEDEDGKYIENESVTIALSNVFPKEDSWYMFFYGTGDFNWDGVKASKTEAKNQNSVTDFTVADKTIPQTGENEAIIGAIVAAVVVCAGAVIGFVKNKNIK